MRNEYATVTLEETRERLLELLLRVARGEQLVITDDGKWGGLLAPPPSPPPTAEEIASAQTRRNEFVRGMLSRPGDDPGPPDGLSIQELVDEQRGRCG